MPEVWPYVMLACVTVGGWVGGLALLDVFTPADARAWRRLSLLRGYGAPRSVLLRAEERSPLLRRIQSALDLQRLLALADRDVTPLAFMTRAMALTFLVLSTLLAVDAAARATSGEWAIPPYVVLLLALSLLPFSLLDLHRAARQRRSDAGRTLGDMMMVVAVMTDGRGLQIDDAVRILSRCSRSPALNDLVDKQGFRRLVTGRFRSSEEKYRLIAQAYAIDDFQRLAEAAASANLGIPERDVYSRLALSIYRERLADARIRSARAKTLVTLPVAGMLIPLLLLIGAPTFAAISSGIQGG